MERFLIILLALWLLTAACGRDLYPVTNGSYHHFPPRASLLIIWGKNQEAVTAAGGWLQKRGFLIAERQRIENLMKMHPYHPSEDREEQALRSVAVTAGAAQVVMIDAAIAPTPPYDSFDPTSRSPGRSYSMAVWIRGLDAETGEVAWNAHASFPPTDSLLERPLEQLTCQALATVWGFRPAGYHKIASGNMCDVEGIEGYGFRTRNWRPLQ
jgi:hypothetical protein